MTLAKKQADEKLEEMDGLYSESDYLKGELSRIRDKYDFSVIDKTKATLERYEAWSNKIMNVSSKS